MNRISRLCALCAALVMSIVTFAQTSVLATLNHEGAITSYYGADGLKNAYAAAEDGDIITLSSGLFNSVNIEGKAIAIRGAGIVTNEQTRQLPTSIKGNFTIKGYNQVVFEGVKITDKIGFANAPTATFSKCFIQEVEVYSSYGVAATIKVIQTVIYGSMALKRYGSGRDDNKSLATLINSVIKAYTQSSTSSRTEATNCIFLSKPDTYEAVYNNCIIDFGGDQLNSDDNAFNCLAIASTENCWNGKSGNNITSGYDDVFKSFDGNIDLNSTPNFELTDAAAAQYYDELTETQVGVYGGTMPYDITPNMPRITKMKVASKSTVDGKLSVDITVDVPTSSSTGQE